MVATIACEGETLCDDCRQFFKQGILKRSSKRQLNNDFASLQKMFRFMFLHGPGGPQTERGGMSALSVWCA
ncbi:MAG TPA: hypothetical protein DCZ95_01255 [Verrucomicrobia bacterium]|nr:MAG: hypothetical protein A2X46_02220 [Lentisphaerae bacterium GWF2_57_35]HBA82695.1 hypothetical protein [Verrucomicrobiota bacterium]